MKKVNNYVKNLVFSAVFAALTCVCTMFVGGSFGALPGYYHAGDVVIYISACIMPFPFGAAAGALGSMCSDLFTGFAAYAIPTFITKFAVASLFTGKSPKILSTRNCIALPLAGIVMSGGYLLYESILYGFSAAVASVPANLTQSAVAAALFLIIAAAADRLNFKRRIAPVFI